MKPSRQRLSYAVASELLCQGFCRHGHNRVELGVNLGDVLDLQLAHQITATHHVHRLTQSAQIIERVLARHQDISGLTALDCAGLAAQPQQLGIDLCSRMQREGVALLVAEHTGVYGDTLLKCCVRSDGVRLK